MAEVLEIHSAKLFNSVTIWLKLKKASIMHDTRFLYSLSVTMEQFKSKNINVHP